MSALPPLVGLQNEDECSPSFAEITGRCDFKIITIYIYIFNVVKTTVIKSTIIKYSVSEALQAHSAL